MINCFQIRDLKTTEYNIQIKVIIGRIEYETIRYNSTLKPVYKIIFNKDILTENKRYII